MEYRHSVPQGGQRWGETHQGCRVPKLKLHSVGLCYYPTLFVLFPFPALHPYSFTYMLEIFDLHRSLKYPHLSICFWGIQPDASICRFLKWFWEAASQTESPELGLTMARWQQSSYCLWSVKGWWPLACVAFQLLILLPLVNPDGIQVKRDALGCITVYNLIVTVIKRKLEMSGCC